MNLGNESLIAGSMLARSIGLPVKVGPLPRKVERILDHRNTTCAALDAAPTKVDVTGHGGR
jgi:hypothetical protein